VNNVREVTDPVREYARLLQRLKNLDTNDANPAGIAITGALTSVEFSQPLLSAYHFMNKRADQIGLLIANIDDDDLDDELRAASLRAVLETRAVFSLSNIGSVWGELIKGNLRQENIILFKFLSPIVSRQYKIPLISPASFVNINEKLIESHEKILLSIEIPQWAKDQVSKGFVDVRFYMQNFDLFGHDAVLEGLSLLLSKTSDAANRMPANSTGGANLKNFCINLVLAVDLFVAVPNVATAAITYYGWAKELSASTQLLLSPPPRQLPPPKSTDRV
jgi:hypothetical protein